jgi:serine/threonine protein kinase
MLGSLTHSDFVVRLYGCFEDATFHFLLMECAFGGELFDVYSDKNLWGSSPHAKFYLASVALGLSHMHEQKIVWRDLKLENCLMDSKGYIKLTDMGIAKHVIGKTFTVCGTADYFAPETLRQQGHNRAVDWWASGVLLFIMMTGRSPFDAPETQQIYKNIIKGIAKVRFPESVPQDAKEVICGLCEKKPENRLPMLKGGLDNLKEMPLFSGFSWQDLIDQKIKAPYIPPAPNYDKIVGKKLSRPVGIDWGSLERSETARLSLI